MKEKVTRHLNWFVFAGYLIVVLIATLPFILNPLNTLVSPIDGDAGYSSILFEAIKRENLNPFIDGSAVSVAYPDGIDNNTGVNRVSFFSTLLLWIGTLMTSAFFVHSLVAIVGVLLSGFLLYLFVRKITGATYPAILAGLTIMFMPAMLSILFSSSPYTHMWIYIVVIWVFWWLATSKPTMKRFFIAFGILLPLLFWTPYYSFHVLMMSGIGTIVVSIIYWLKYRRRNAVIFAVAATLTLLLFAAFYYFVGTTSQHSSIPNRSIEEIYEQSSHPLMYLTPGFFSIFGHGVHEFVATLVPRVAGASLYLGITVLTASCFALVFLRKRKGVSVKIKYAIVLSISMFFASFLFSLAPTIAIFGVDVPTPSYLIAEFVPSLRAGQRLVMPMIASLLILFGIGLAVIQTKSPRKYKTLILSIVALIVAFDIASFPLARHTTIESRAVFKELSYRKEALGAVYLHNSLVSNPGQLICYPQFQHKMPLVNDCGIQRDPYNFDLPKRTLANIIKQPLCRQVDALHQMKVEYLIVAKDDNREILNCIENVTSVRPILSDNAYVIYQLPKTNS